MTLASKLFIIASITYLFIATLMGFVMAWKSGKWVLRLMPSHAHFNLAGWVSMLIFGFAYFLLPIASGHGLYSSRLPYLHFALANIGLLGMASAWLASRFPNSRVKVSFVWPFGLLYIFSIWIFVFNLVMTLFFF
ncbi:hypothetical protein PLCT1_02527 [Planctomycetaceae bacterium]|nr:hypothetical protein PLCT1_02527 [Planctomycetaceae bacterium]